MSRFSPLLLVFCAVLTLTACDNGPTKDLLAPEAVSEKIVDGRNFDSNVFLLPPIGDSYTASIFDIYTPTQIEICSLPVPEGDDLEQYTDADWNALEQESCIEEATDPWFAVYDQDSSKDTYIELQTDADGNPQHYQLNLKTDAAMANQAFRVTVFTQSLDLTAGRSWTEKAYFDLALFENSSAINVPSDWVGETAGQNFPVKYVVEIAEGDNFLAEVDCEGGLFTGTTAGASIEPNTFHECDNGGITLVLLQERVELAEGEVCIPVGWVQDGLCYRWQLYLYDADTDTYTPYTHPDGFATPMLVIYCLASEGGEWAGLRAPSPSDSDEVFFTENASAAGVFTPDCEALQPDESVGLLGFMDGVRSSVARLIGLDPKPLYAADKGFGELVFGGLSHFGRAEAEEIVKVSGDGQAGLVGAELAEPLVVRAVTIPHHSEDSAEPIANALVTFQVTVGDGTLRDADGDTASTLQVETDEDGHARVWWTLGDQPSPPDHEVDVYGDGFGFLDENNVFQDRLTYTATAFDVVTDFLEPLDEKGTFSGDPHQLFLPEVLICAAPADGQPCSSPEERYETSEIKVTEENGRKFFQVNWKPRDSGIAEGTFVIQVLLQDGPVVGESVNIVVEKGGKVELTEGGLQINPTTDLPIKFTLSQVTP